GVLASSIGKSGNATWAIPTRNVVSRNLDSAGLVCWAENAVWPRIFSPRPRSGVSGARGWGWHDENPRYRGGGVAPGSVDAGCCQYLLGPRHLQPTSPNRTGAPRGGQTAPCSSRHPQPRAPEYRGAGRRTQRRWGVSLQGLFEALAQLGGGGDA